MRYALVQDNHQFKCHCISIRESVDDLLTIPVDGKAQIIPIPDTVKQDGDAISQYCSTHEGVPV